MAECLTVAEVYRMQFLLIERFGGVHGVRDKNAVEAAVFRAQTGYYNSIEEEAAALMESGTITHLSMATSA
jgi:death on curing protein